MVWAQAARSAGRRVLTYGWSPDADRLVAALTGLAGAIERRGGQRRARPYLAAQLRRLERRGHLAAG